MANEYTPTVWRTGDIITAEKLNKIEEGIANAGQPSWETVFEGSVTTESSPMGNTAIIDCDENISTDSIKVTFNGVEYECPVIANGDAHMYGGFDIQTQAPDFSVYPFLIVSYTTQPSGYENMIGTENSETVTLKIEVQEVQPTSDFSTCNVTITNNTATDYKVDVAFIEEGSMILYTGASSNRTRNLEVVLYKGEAKMSIFDNNDEPVLERVLSITGNASYDGTEFTITGDCTITMTDN